MASVSMTALQPTIAGEFTPPALASFASRFRNGFALPALAAAGVALWDPSRNGGPPLCIVRACTGGTCPGCGLTRAVGALLHGRWHEAIRLHVLAPVFVVQVFLACMAWVFFAPRLRGRMPSWLVPTLLTLNTVAFVVVWLIRTSTGQIAVLG